MSQASVSNTPTRTALDSLTSLHHGPHEGDEGWREANDQGWPRPGTVRGDGVEEVGLHEGHQQPCRRGHQGGEERGQVRIPGLCMVKTRLKPATKAGKREVFGKVMM